MKRTTLAEAKNLAGFLSGYNNKKAITALEQYRTMCESGQEFIAALQLVRFIDDYKTTLASKKTNGK